MIRINGELVDPNLVEETFSRIKSEAEARLQVSCCERDEEFMTEAEEEVIDSILIAQEADRRQPEIPADQLKDRLEATIKLYRKHGASWDMLEAQRPQLRDECVANLRMESLLDAVLADVPELTDEDVRKYYSANVDDYRCKPEVRCLHLVKLLEPDDQPVSPMDLLEKMISLREEVLGDADFAEVAKRETDKHDKEIDLGWIPLDRPSNPFESILFSLREDEVSPVLCYEHAYHLIKVTGIKPSEAPPFEELEKEIRERAENERRRTALKQLAATLRKDATVEREDFGEEG